MHKRFFKYAFYFGFLTGIAIGLSMDLMLGASLGGGWQEAVRNDITKIFGAQYADNNLYVYLGVALSIATIGLFGGLFTGVIGLFFSLLLNKIQKQGQT